MPAPKGHKPYLGCETGGRPKKWSTEAIEAEAVAFELWMKQPDSLWYEDFCLQRDISPEYLSIWAKENEKFNQVYKKSQVWQKSKLIKGGLLNQFNSSFTRFVMANTCGWHEKQQITGEVINHLSQMMQKADGASKDLIDG